MSGSDVTPRSSSSGASTSRKPSPPSWGYEADVTVDGTRRRGSSSSQPTRRQDEAVRALRTPMRAHTSGCVRLRTTQARQATEEEIKRSIAGVQRAIAALPGCAPRNRRPAAVRAHRLPRRLAAATTAAIQAGPRPVILTTAVRRSLPATPSGGSSLRCRGDRRGGRCRPGWNRRRVDPRVPGPGYVTRVLRAPHFRNRFAVHACRAGSATTTRFRCQSTCRFLRARRSPTGETIR
ncbi:hypothetical protein HBB16_11465 [Pseudonocardia sp. MCCB 268]|nr:hypothetical protein [Pseudonocardia cytotoxica]